MGMMGMIGDGEKCWCKFIHNLPHSQKIVGEVVGLSWYFCIFVAHISDI